MLESGGFPWGWIIGVYIIYGVVTGAYCAALADEKGRDPTIHFFGGLLFGFIDLLYLIAIEKKTTSARDQLIAELRIKDAEIIELAKIIYSDKSVDRIKTASAVLGDMGPRAEPAIDILINCIDCDVFIRQESAVYILNAIGKGAKRALPHLERLKQKYEEMDKTELARVEAILKEMINKIKAEKVES